MTDEEFIRALETGRLAPSDFDHAGHVRAAYAYLQSGDFLATVERMRRAIRAFAGFLGKPERYHETITVAYVALIQEYLHERGNRAGWTAFARATPELFRADLLSSFYSPSQLASDTARKLFVLPRPGLALGRQAARPEVRKAE